MKIREVKVTRYVTEDGSEFSTELSAKAYAFRAQAQRLSDVYDQYNGCYATADSVLVWFSELGKEEQQVFLSALQAMVDLEACS